MILIKSYIDELIKLYSLKLNFLWYAVSPVDLAYVLDTFASKTAAIEDETADASVGNVTGSNAVNVFLG